MAKHKLICHWKVVLNQLDEFTTWTIDMKDYVCIKKQTKNITSKTEQNQQKQQQKTPQTPKPTMSINMFIFCKLKMKNHTRGKKRESQKRI